MIQAHGRAIQSYPREVSPSIGGTLGGTDTATKIFYLEKSKA